MLPAPALPVASFTVPPPPSSSRQWATSPGISFSDGSTRRERDFSSSLKSDSRGEFDVRADTEAYATAKPCWSVTSRTTLMPGLAYFGSGIGTHSQRVGDFGPVCIAWVFLRDSGGRIRMEDAPPGSAPVVRALGRTISVP